MIMTAISSANAYILYLSPYKKLPIKLRNEKLLAKPIATSKPIFKK